MRIDAYHDVTVDDHLNKETTMAEAVTISHGDTLNSILKNKRGLKAHEVHAWLGKLRPLNPHISDLNR
ncbi:MAG: hypothetical protein PVG41_20875, partial [Desulfobacteraceae bacterium]